SSRSSRSCRSSRSPPRLAKTIRRSAWPPARTTTSRNPWMSRSSSRSCECGCRGNEVTTRPQDFDIELPLLIEAIYVKYHYDFRQYARASLKRRLTAALSYFDCPTLSQLQDKVLRNPTMFPQLLDFLTVPVSEMFR